MLYLTEALGYSSLQEGGVRLIPHDACRKPDVYGNHVTADMICAGLNGCVDACQVGQRFETPTRDYWIQGCQVDGYVLGGKTDLRSLS